VWDVPGLEQYHGKETFLTEALTIEANRAVDQAVDEGKPFFLYLSHYAVHVPFAVDTRFYQPYRDRGFDHTEAMYAAMIEGMDESLGDVMANIERHGLTDSTLFLFLSDNGGYSAQGRGGRPHSHNRPLASGKGSAYEGGVRVPMIVRWPGVTAKGTNCEQPIIVEDVFSTILEVAGVSDFGSAKGSLDGLSFVNLLRGEHDRRRESRPIVWHFPNHWGPTGPGIGPTSSIRQGSWKLVYYHEDQQYELFDLVHDLGERHNLASLRADARDRLANELGAYLSRVDAQMPVNKATGRIVPYPSGERTISAP
jgi:arylsulfatase A-like enzyme